MVLFPIPAVNLQGNPVSNKTSSSLNLLVLSVNIFEGLTWVDSVRTNPKP